ncbi:hypothetical protein NKG94_40085 [Micromonospora sp. M12]
MTQATGTAGTIRRTIGTVAAVLTATTLLAGCGVTDGPATAPQSSPSASPKDALLNAVPDGGEGRSGSAARTRPAPTAAESTRRRRRSSSTPRLRRTPTASS